MATEPGLRLKNARSFFLSNPPRNASYGSGFFRRLVSFFLFCRNARSLREASVFDSRLASANFLGALDAAFAFRSLESAFFASLARRSAMISSSVSAGSPRTQRSKLRKRSRLRGREEDEEAFASTRREEDPVPSSATRGGSDEAEEEEGPPPEVDATTLARSSTAVSSRLESKEEAASS